MFPTYRTGPVTEPLQGHLWLSAPNQTSQSIRLQCSAAVVGALVLACAIARGKEERGGRRRRRWAGQRRQPKATKAPEEDQKRPAANLFRSGWWLLPRRWRFFWPRFGSATTCWTLPTQQRYVFPCTNSRLVALNFIMGFLVLRPGRGPTSNQCGAWGESLLGEGTRGKASPEGGTTEA